MQKIKPILFLLFLFLIVYTRCINLSWGLPYPMHPDERNMADAVSRLSYSQYLKPDFFAYGQVTLYFAYGLVQGYYFLSNTVKSISFSDSVMALRLISALASIFSVFVLMRMVEFFFLHGILVRKNRKFTYPLYLMLVFSPFAIQFSHFGTTESLLSFFYLLIVYFCLKTLFHKKTIQRNIFLLAILCGLAVAIKVSSLIFTAVPLSLIVYQLYQHRKLESAISLIYEAGLFLFIVLITSILASPYNFASFTEFVHSIHYESDVALGRYVVFYTRQFVRTLPVFFQATSIFPYALGWPVFLSGVAGLILLPYKKEINLLRFAFIIYFLPQAFLFTKWTRFMAPVFPLMLFFALLFLYVYVERLYERLKNHHFVKGIIYSVFLITVFFSIISGISYLSVYQNEDIRFQASDWINENVPRGSTLLSETANVVDLPLRQPGYLLLTSFNFYDLDQNPVLPNLLADSIKQADYILVPSRRVFMNHTCLTPKNSEYRIQNMDSERCRYLEQAYPLLNDYYRKLFSGELGFTQVAEFTSYPSLSLSGWKWVEFPDEAAEESWSVFDHPVIRIYKKI